MAAMAMALPLSQPPPHSCSSNATATATATGAGGSRSCTLVASSSIVRIIGKPKMTRNDEHVRYGAARHRNGTIMCTRTASATNEVELQRVKNNLLRLVLNTSRGVNTSSDQRALVEEVMISLETSNAGVHLDLSLLHGTWLLQYTTASDVLSILRTSELPFFQVGQIFQKFDCLGGTDNGTIFNVVRWSLSNVLQDTNGATLAVTADFSLVSSRTIQLRFKEANVGEVLIGEAVQALVAPAILPRTFLNLQAIRHIPEILECPNSGYITGAYETVKQPTRHWDTIKKSYHKTSELGQLLSLVVAYVTLRNPGRKTKSICPCLV